MDPDRETALVAADEDSAEKLAAGNDTRLATGNHVGYGSVTRYKNHQSLVDCGPRQGSS